MRYTLLLILILVLPLYAQPDLAQMEVVGTPVLSETEIVAKRTPNGRYCAGIKLISDLEGFSYDSYLGVMGMKEMPGQDIIYVDPAERVLLLFHVGYEPLKVILSEIGIQLQERQMWEIKVKGGKVDVLPVSFILNPQDAEVIIDGKNMGSGPTFQLKPGEYNVRINKLDYRMIEDTIFIDPNHVLFEYKLDFRPKLIFIKGRKFKMGDVFGEGSEDEKPVHEVEVSSFYMGKYEVTFDEYDAFCEATDREKKIDDGRERSLYPAILVNWYDAIEYCNWLSVQEGLRPFYEIDKTQKDLNNMDSYDNLKWSIKCNIIANGYRLPTEAEWEYAAREKGREVRFGNGKNIADPKEINFNGAKDYKKSYSIAGINRRKTTPVGSFTSNSLGLYDMSGNVSEWCWGWYGKDYYSESISDNPLGPDSGSERVLRGGNYLIFPYNERCTDRGHSRPVSSIVNCPGFRICRNAEDFDK